ncbi:MAG: dipeptidase, partial [Gemmatimonadota bacterium]
PFEMARQLDRVHSHLVILTPTEEERAARLANGLVMISLHEHLGVFPARIDHTPEYIRHGRMATAFEGLAVSNWDAVFDNLMDGLCQIESRHGWKWTEVLHDLGIRLCDLAHQNAVIVARGVDDIVRAHEEGKLAWIAAIEGAAMIENELDRIEVLYGFGVRLLGITYSEANALGSGLKEARDSGLSTFGRKAVERMNKVGMLIDCSHAGDQTTLDVIEASTKPIVLSHIGARALWDSRRLAPDEVLRACADRGGVIGIEAAPHTTITRMSPRHSLESYMEHFEYVADLVGIDHVSFGPDTVYGDHVGLHRTYSAGLSIEESRGALDGGPGGDGAGHPQVEYVAGIENPTEGSHNILRWLVQRAYSDEDIAKVVGQNVLRVLREVWS